MDSNYTTPACSGPTKRPSSPKRTTKAPQPPAAKAPTVWRTQHVPVQLAFEQWRGDTQQWRARGGRHAYRITRIADREYYAAQKGGSAFTPVGGVCTTKAQAEDLAQRYENGAPQLSHRAYRDLPYKSAVAKLEGQLAHRTPTSHP